MYMNLWRLAYPKPSEISIVKDDVVDPNDPGEHQYNIKIQDRLCISLTKQELETLVEKGGFVLQDAHREEHQGGLDVKCSGNGGCSHC